MPRTSSTLVCFLFLPTFSDAFQLFMLGLGIFACTYLFMNIWVYTGEVTAKRLREHYLRAVLRQDVAFFDTVGPGEITSRIQTDTRKSFSQLRFSCLTMRGQTLYNEAYRKKSPLPSMPLEVLFLVLLLLIFARGALR